MSRRLRPGKVPWELVAPHMPQSFPDEVLLGPACGEDAALLRIGGEVWAVASDPITYTAADAGRLAVIVNANDVAVRGAKPAFFTAVLLLTPDDASADRTAELLGQIADTCAGIGATLVGGHTEITPGLEHSLVVGTMLGRVWGRAVTSGGLRAGDAVGLTRWAGLEGTAIILSQLGERLRAELGTDRLGEAERILAGDWLSVVPEALAAAGVEGVTALHDVTEGGVGEALYELAVASGTFIRADEDAVPVLPATRLISDDLGVDPLGLIGSGAVLVGCEEHARRELAGRLWALDVPITWIGKAVEAEEAPGTALPRFPRDELLKLSACDGIRAVLFDMDGTLVHTTYDWPAIRRQLGIDHPSIIDGLNGLPLPERDARWRELEEIEDQATRGASVAEGATALLDLLREHGMRTALVTNNTAKNAAELLERFGLRLDAVVTRDTGLHKPSGAPLAAAARRLGVRPEECLVVGDSEYDLEAARDAGCARTCILHERAEALGREADLAFPSIPGFVRYLGYVLAEG